MIAVWACVLMLGGGVIAWTLGGQARISAAADLKPGLAVCYIYEYVRHVDQIAEWEKHRKCEPGAPLAILDYRVGEGTVLTSTSKDGVMAKITGFIHLDKAGAFKFAFESNDGVRLKIDGELIVDDPDVHSDQYSDVGTMEVASPGWYPLAIDYFERKGTSSLRFFWRPPGVEGNMPLVPAEAMAH
jgi:RNase P/RNase MRP subunit p29